jgi:Tol biopolymer transport system component
VPGPFFVGGWCSSARLHVGLSSAAGSSGQGDEPSQLYTVASDGSALTQVTSVDYATGANRPGEARWTPDGRRIIASMGVVEGGRVVDVNMSWIDPITGEIAETVPSGAMPTLQP